jgi:hypothetical protein
MNRFRIASFIFALLVPLFAMAQDNAPLIGSQASEPQTELLVAPVLSDGIYRILVIGDSMAGGLGAGMTRMVQGDTGYEIVNRFNESSAITRPEVYDWASAIPKIMDGKNFTAVVVLIGLNDRQDIRNDGGRYVFNTPEWTTAYQANTDSIVDALMAQKVKIFWLGQPPMGDPAYDADMKTVTTLQRDRVIAKGVTFIDTRPLLLGADGNYVDLGPDDTGEVRKLRQRDGVTFLKQGNNKFGQLILAAIKSADTIKPPAVTTPVATTPALATPTVNPVFGQTDAHGATVLLNSSDVVASATPNTAVAKPAAVADTRAPAPGTAAEKLFTSGESVTAPPGRFDDFSYVAPPPEN